MTIPNSSRTRSLVGNRQTRLILVIALVVGMQTSAEALWEECLPAWTEVHQGSFDGPVLRIEDYHMNCQSYDTIGYTGPAFRVGVPLDLNYLPAFPIRDGQKGDPVTGDGEFLQNETDLTFPGEGLPYEFTRTYRSRAQYTGDLGYGWDHNFNQHLIQNCNGSVVYTNGRGGTVVFQPDPSLFGHFIPDYRNKLSLQESSTSTFTLTEWTTGNVLTFNSGRLASITSAAGFSIGVSWSLLSGSHVWQVSAVSDTTGHRTIYYNYYHPLSHGPWLLRCLSTDTTCATPYVSFNYDTTNLELSSVVKGNETAGTSYRYHHGESSVSWVPSTTINQACATICNPKSYDCNNRDVCGAAFASCQINSTDDCVRVREGLCIATTCAASDNVCDSDCEDESVQQNLQGCVGGQTWPAYQQQCINSYLEPTRYPYCSERLGGGSPANCVASCLNFYRNSNYQFTFGQPTDLNHNIIEIDDANGRVILKNTFGPNPGDVSFDRVIDQQWGDTSHGYFAYHDLVLEATYSGSSPPSTPDPAHVQSMAQFSSLNICPSLSCDASGCPAPVNDSNAEAPSQRPVFATVTTDIYGVVYTDYYNSGWDLLREINWRDAQNPAEITNYNYGRSGNLDSDGEIAGVQSPEGIRTCFARNDAGAPTTILHIPAPGYGGNADWRAESLSYVGGSTSSLLQTYVPDSRGTASTTYGGYLGKLRPTSVQVQVDAATSITTTYAYAYDFLPTSMTSPSGAVTRFDEFDTLAVQPTAVTMDATGASPVRKYSSFDPVFSLVQEKGLQNGAAVHFSYDQSARTTIVQNRNAPTDSWFTQTYSYGNGEQPTQITDAHHTAYPVFNTNNDLINLMEWPANPNEIGRRTCYHHSADGRLLETINPEGDSVLRFYDTAGRLSSIVKGYNPTQTTDAWASGCSREHAPPQGDPGLEAVESWTYSPGSSFLTSHTVGGLYYQTKVDGFGRIIETTDGRGVKLRRGYDRLGRVVWEATYDAVANVPNYKTPDFQDVGLVSAVEYSFDNLGRTTQVARWHIEDRTKRVRTVAYNDATNTITTTEGSRTTSVTTDGAGRPIQRTFADGSTESIAYSQNGLHSTSTLHSNVGPIVTDRGYDGLMLVSSQAVNGQTVFTESHDVDGRVLSRYKETEGTQVLGYDSFRRNTTVTQQTVAGNSTTTRAWDGDDRLTQITDANQKTTSFVFDGLGRVLRMQDPLLQITSNRYAAGSNRITSRQSPWAGTSTTTTYDPVGHLAVEITQLTGYPDLTRQFTYDAEGRILTASISGGLNTDNTATFTYDSLGRKISENNSYYGWAAGVVHSYDLYDNVKTTEVADWQPSMIVHQYDSLRRLASVDVNTVRLATYNYGSIGNGGPQSISYGTGADTLFTYDARGRETAFQVDDPSGYITLQYRQVYGTDGILREKQYQNVAATSPSSDVFQVDPSGRITAESIYQTGVPLFSGSVDNSTVNGWISTGPDSRGYSPDLVGNWSSRTMNGTSVSYSYNALNERTTASDTSTASYDGSENLTALSATGETYQYYPLGWVASASKGTRQASYTYDALGRRIGDRGTGVSQYPDGVVVWDGDQLVARGSPTIGWILEVPGAGADDTLAGVENLGGAVPSQLAWLWIYHHGPDGSVLATSNPSGGFLESYNYSAFGEMTVRDYYGNPVASSSIHTRVGFQGQFFEEAIGTYWMRSREYDPRIGRFVSTDPIGLRGGVNLYDFVGGNPLSFADPRGLWKQRYISWLKNQFINNDSLSILRRLPIPILSSYAAYAQDDAELNLEAIQGNLNGRLFGLVVSEGLLFTGEVMLMGSSAFASKGGAVILTASAETGAESGRVALAEEQVSMLQEELDPIAQEHRTTAVGVGTTAEGTQTSVAAAGANANLSPAQREAAAAAGIQSAWLPAADGIHAEYKVVEFMRAAGITPEALATSWDICPACKTMLQDAGARLVGMRTAIWPGR